MANNQFDFTQLFKQFDPQEMTAKLQESFNVDLGAINEAQSKNLQTMMNANKIMTDGAQAILQKQADMFQIAMTEAGKAVESLSGSGSPQEVAEKQAELMKAAYETALKNTAEISELAKQTQEGVSAKVNERIAESLEEIKDNMSKIS